MAAAAAVCAQGRQKPMRPRLPQRRASGETAGASGLPIPSPPPSLFCRLRRQCLRAKMRVSALSTADARDVTGKNRRVSGLDG
eukprot:336594-Chlamydomonas_euryale.AAC.5